MRNIPLAQLQGGDIVLVECTLVRTEELPHTKNILFALHALYWLAEKPRIPRTKVTTSRDDLSTIIEC